LQNAINEEEPPGVKKKGKFGRSKNNNEEVRKEKHQGSVFSCGLKNLRNGQRDRKQAKGGKESQFGKRNGGKTPKPSERTP